MNELPTSYALHAALDEQQSNLQLIRTTASMVDMGRVVLDLKGPDEEPIAYAVATRDPKVILALRRTLEAMDRADDEPDSESPQITLDNMDDFDLSPDFLGAERYLQLSRSLKALKDSQGVINRAYQDRARLLGLLSTIYPSTTVKDRNLIGTEYETVLLTRLPVGQISYHIHEDDRPFISHVIHGLFDWDGHSDSLKNSRLDMQRVANANDVAEENRRGPNPFTVLLEELADRYNEIQWSMRQPRPNATESLKHAEEQMLNHLRLQALDELMEFVGGQPSVARADFAYTQGMDNFETVQHVETEGQLPLITEVQNATSPKVNYVSLESTPDTSIPEQPVQIFPAADPSDSGS